MTKTKTITFGDFRRFLQQFGYALKYTDSACVFHRAKKNLLVFRRYSDGEVMNRGDLISTRAFLDAWGFLDASDFDASLAHMTKPA